VVCASSQQSPECLQFKFLEPRLRRLSATVYGSPQDQEGLYHLKKADPSPRGRVLRIVCPVCPAASPVAFQALRCTSHAFQPLQQFKYKPSHGVADSEYSSRQTYCGPAISLNLRSDFENRVTFDDYWAFTGNSRIRRGTRHLTETFAYPEHSLSVLSIRTCFSHRSLIESRSPNRGHIKPWSTFL
jgi:hypothetical protein